MKLTIVREVHPDGTVDYRVMGSETELEDWLASKGATHLEETWKLLDNHLVIVPAEGTRQAYITTAHGEYCYPQFSAFVEKECEESPNVRLANAQSKIAFSGKLIAKKQGCGDINVAYIFARKLAKRTVLVQVVQIQRNGPNNVEFLSSLTDTIEVPDGKAIWGSVAAMIVQRSAHLACSDEHLTTTWDTELPLE